MSAVSDLIRTFFADFERASTTFAPDLLAPLFSDPYVAADPDGRVHAVKRDDFLAGVAQRQAFFQSIGFQFVTIAPLEETWLDTHYVMVRAHTQMRFQKAAGPNIDLGSDAVYILYLAGNAPQVVFNLTHEDLTKVMQQHGLLP
jgi:hypothetical protein